MIHFLLLGPGHWQYCIQSYQCPKGVGDCDQDNQCQSGLWCGKDNCDKERNGYSKGHDCCTDGMNYVV